MWALQLVQVFTWKTPECVTSLQCAWLDLEAWHGTGLHGCWYCTACQRLVRERNLQQYVRTWRNRCAAAQQPTLVDKRAAAKRLPARRQRDFTQTAKSSENQACNSFHACGIMKGRQDSHWHTYTHVCPWAYCAGLFTTIIAPSDRCTDLEQPPQGCRNMQRSCSYISRLAAAAALQIRMPTKQTAAAGSSRRETPPACPHEAPLLRRPCPAARRSCRTELLH